MDAVKSYSFPRQRHYINPDVINALAEYVKKKTGEDWLADLNDYAQSEATYDTNLADYHELGLGPAIKKQYQIVYPDGRLYSEELYDEDTIADALLKAQQEEYKKHFTDVSDIATAVGGRKYE